MGTTKTSGQQNGLKLILKDNVSLFMESLLSRYSKMKKLLKNEKLEGGIIHAPLYFFEPIGGQNKTLLSHFQDELLGECHIQKGI